MTGSRSRAKLLTGRPSMPADPRPFRAGPVTLLLDGADLRHVAVGPVELMQRVYVAVRDAPWNTIPAVYTNWTYYEGADRFDVTFHARHRYDTIDFEWNGTIHGTPDGVIRYEMDGICHGLFKYSKIGFNAHHGLNGSIGRPYRAQTERGELRGVLPKGIDPQRIVGGTLSGMFDPYSELAIEVGDGIESIVRLDGDLLELQDHRNWTDANFKSYGTPLSRGFPFDSSDGLRIRQTLTVTYAGSVPDPEPSSNVDITVGDRSSRPAPQIGFGMPSHDVQVSSREAALLRAVKPAHVRVDVVMSDPAWTADLERAAADARLLGAPLELAVHAHEGHKDAVKGLADHLARLDVPVARVLVYYLVEGFSAMLSLTPEPVVRLVRDGLAPVIGSVVVAGGTNQNFADINRDRPAGSVMTGVCFSMSPTVHAADDTSIIENLRGQAEVVEFTRTFAAGRQICVSPVTIATRFGPYPAGPAGPGDLPPPVDVRQAALLGAAWTTGSIAALARSGAHSVTYYETTGWRGIVEQDEGNPMAELFPSRPGDVFPMYHVFADVAEWRTGTLVDAGSSDESQAVVLGLDDGSGRHLLVANVTPTSQVVTVRRVRPGSAVVRILDETTAVVAMETPAVYRASGSPAVIGADGSLALELRPYAVARIDLPA